MGMEGRGLPKSALLRRPWQYRLVYERGRRLRGLNFSLIILPGEKADNRLGISIHGEKLAVRRNRIKRVIREFFRQNRDFLPPPFDIVFTVRPGFAPASPQEIHNAVSALVHGPRGLRLKQEKV